MFSTNAAKLPEHTPAFGPTRRSPFRKFAFAAPSPRCPHTNSAVASDGAAKARVSTPNGVAFKRVAVPLAADATSGVQMCRLRLPVDRNRSLTHP